MMGHKLLDSGLGMLSFFCDESFHACDVSTFLCVDCVHALILNLPDKVVSAAMIAGMFVGYIVLVVVGVVVVFATAVAVSGIFDIAFVVTLFAVV